jgi:hypothetical protein
MVVDALRVGKLPGDFGVVERPLPGGQFAWQEDRSWSIARSTASMDGNSWAVSDEFKAFGVE